MLYAIARKGIIQDMEFKSFTRALFIIGLLIILPNCIRDAEDQKIPSWVPCEAVDSARVYLNGWSEYYKRETRKYILGEEIGELEKSKLYLKYAWELVCIDYLAYSEGNRIQDHFYTHDTTGVNIMSVGFGVYYRDKQLGAIRVILKSDSTWTWGGTSIKPYNWEDYLKVVFRAYPNYQGYKVYRHCSKFYYLPEKDGEINEIMDCGYLDKKFVSMIHDPISYIAEKKRQYIDYLEHLPPPMDSVP